MFAIAVGAPAGAQDQAVASSLLLTRAGDQIFPTMAGSLLAWVDAAPSGGEVFFADTASPPPWQASGVSSSLGLVGGPEVDGDLVAWRANGKVRIFSRRAGSLVGDLDAPGSGRIALSSSAVAWDQDAPGGADVVWMPLGGGIPVPLQRPGSQHSAALAFQMLAFLDDTTPNTVRLVDTSSGAELPPVPVVPPDAASSVQDVAIWGADAISAPLLAVTLKTGTGTEIQVLDVHGTVLGVRSSGSILGNVHLAGDWVAYEEDVLGVPQVRLWLRATARTFFTAMPVAPQQFNHLVLNGTAATVLWSEPGPAGLDLYELTQPLPEPPPSAPGLACSDPVPASAVLADFTVTQEGRSQREIAHDPLARRERHDDREERKDGWHLRDTTAHDERWHSEWHWRAFDAREIRVAPPGRLLVCLDAIDVASAWVGVGSEVVAAPTDFRAGTLSLEAHLTVPAGESMAGAVIIAKPGGQLRVRVIDDPGGGANGPSDGSTCLARGDCPAPPSGILSKVGCGSSGEVGGVLSLLLAAIALARPMRRRSRS